MATFVQVLIFCNAWASGTACETKISVAIRKLPACYYYMYNLCFRIDRVGCGRLTSDSCVTPGAQPIRSIGTAEPAWLPWRQPGDITAVGHVPNRSHGLVSRKARGTDRVFPSAFQRSGAAYSFW